MGSNHDNHRGGLHGIQHVMDYYLYMFCVEQCVVDFMCVHTGNNNIIIIIHEFVVFVCL